MSPPSPPSPEEAAQHRSWRRWAIGSVVVLFLALLPFAALWVYDMRLVAAANHLIAQLNRDEPGWRDVKIDDSSLAPDRDSMVAIERIAAMLPKKWGDDIELGTDYDIYVNYPPSRMPASYRAILETLLKKNAAALESAHGLKDQREGRFVPRRAADGKSLDMEDLQKIRTVAQLLQYAVYVEVDRQELRSAWNDMRAQLNLGKTLSQGNQMAGLVRIATDGIAIDSVQHILAQGEVAESDLAAMQKDFADEAEFEFFFPFQPAECASLLHGLDDLIAGIDLEKSMKMLQFKEEDLGWWGTLNERVPRFMLRKTKIKSLERMAATYRLKSLQGFARYDAADRLMREFPPPAKDGSDRFDFVNTYIPYGLVKNERGIRSALQRAEVGLAAERFRLKHGRWPATPTELVDKELLPRVPEDLYDGAPLRIRHAPDGLVIYEVGNKKDFDGTFYDDPAKLPDDLRDPYQFRLWNPDHRGQPPLPVRKRDDDDPPPPKE